MRSLNGEEMTAMLDGVSASLLLAHRVTESDLQSNPQIKEGLLNILAAMVKLDETVIDAKLAKYLTPQGETAVKFIKRNNIELALIDGGASKSALTII